MAKTDKTAFINTVIMLFVLFIPVFGSLAEQNAVIYASLCMLIMCAGYIAYNTRRLAFTGTFLFMMCAALVSFFGMIFFSDKGSQFSLGALFLMCAAASMTASGWKTAVGREKCEQALLRLIYCAALIYAAVAILYQIFIESSFFGCGMDLGNGSSGAAACLMAVGIGSCIKIFKDGKKHIKAMASIPFMFYVLIMAKSFWGYLFGALLIFTWAMRQKHRKLEALAALIMSAAFGICGIISGAASVLKNSEYLNGGVKGLVSITGVGKGGYNAVNAVIDKGYLGDTSVFYLLTESLGIIGLIMICLFAAFSAYRYVKSGRYSDEVAMLLIIAIIFLKSSSLVFMLPLLCIYYSIRGEAFSISVHRGFSFVFLLPCVFFLILAAAYIPYAAGDHYCDIENYEKAAKCYAAGARMELFNSAGWERAYKAQLKGHEIDPGVFINKEYIENAARYNKKNYKYKRDLAQAYSEEANYLKALEIWDEIMLRYDREYLYPMYAEKILDVMEYCPIGLEKTEELYLKLDELGKKAEDKDVVLKVNNILALSQQYYINAREGTNIAGDMYNEAASAADNLTEVEYESGIAEG